MPLLRFICIDCGKIFEELIYDTSDIKCPECGSKDIKRHYQGKAYLSMAADDTPSCDKSGVSCPNAYSCPHCR